MSKTQTFSLSRLLSPWLSLDERQERRVTGMSLDSRTIEQGFLFLALDGYAVNAEQFVVDAIDHGAVAVLHQTPLSDVTQRHADSLDVPVFLLPELPQILGALANEMYQYPSRHLSVVGVTGTDGKTSVTQFLAQAFELLDEPAAVMGTLGNGRLNQIEKTNNTTPDALTVHRYLRQWQSSGVHHAVMEVSSHGLEQGRVNGIEFDVAVLTNLARDHMDYHKSTVAYAAAKQRLFDSYDAKALVINADDDFGCFMMASLTHSKMIGYGLTSDMPTTTAFNVCGEALQFDAQGFSMRVRAGRQTERVTVGLLGRFNAHNVLAVIAVLMAKGVSLEQACQTVASLMPVRGRMELISQQPLTVVDYAHTPQALKAALMAVKEHQAGGKGRLFCVFGCGGNRDKGKRAQMGMIAEQYADTVVITNDNPRNESPEGIVQDIQQGMKSSHTVEMDRQQAIRMAVKAMAPNDVLLVAGKGHETQQIMGDAVMHFDDAQTLRAILEEVA